MEGNRNTDIFTQSDCLSSAVIQQYVLGDLSDAERRGVEKHLVDCELCSDAIEGFSVMDDKTVIVERTQAINKKIQQSSRRKMFVLWKNDAYSYAAAAAILIMICSSVFVLVKNNPEADKLISEDLSPPLVEAPKQDKDAAIEIDELEESESPPVPEPEATEEDIPLEKVAAAKFAQPVASTSTMSEVADGKKAEVAAGLIRESATAGYAANISVNDLKQDFTTTDAQSGEGRSYGEILIDESSIVTDEDDNLEELAEARDEVMFKSVTVASQAVATEESKSKSVKNRKLEDRNDRGGKIVLAGALGTDMDTIVISQSDMAAPMGDSENEVFSIVEEMPQFQGGEDDLLKYLADNVHYPKQAKDAGIEGTVYVTFTVMPDSTLANIKVLQSVGGGCDEEAVRAIEEMPNWNPGRQKGKKVPVEYNLPVRFKLNDK